MQEFINFSQADFYFRICSGAHLIPLGMLLLFAVILYAGRNTLRKPHVNMRVRYMLAALLFTSEISYQVWLLLYENWHINTSLPLHLCGLSALLSVVMLCNRSYKIFEVVYFWGLAGAGQALITPDLATYSFPHYLYYKFFLSHCLIILSVLFMSWVEQYRPTLKSIVKVFIITNVYAVFVGAFNYFTGGNYLYLCSKPAGTSLLDYLGPWPWYIGGLEIMLLLFCLICYLPFIFRSSCEGK